MTISVAEEHLPLLAGAGDDGDVVREELLRFSREIAFAAARVYAAAAETRGSWDARLEALVIDGLVRGSIVGDPLPSQLAALGWHGTGPLAALVGHAPDRPAATGAGRRLHRARTGWAATLMAGVHGDRLVVVVGGVQRPDRGGPAPARRPSATARSWSARWPPTSSDAARSPRPR